MKTRAPFTLVGTEMKDTQAGSIETGKVNKRRASKNEMNEPGGEAQVKARNDFHYLEEGRQLLDADLVSEVWFEPR